MTTPVISFIYAYPMDAGRRRLYIEKKLGNYPTEKEVKDVLDTWIVIWNKANSDNRVISELMKVTKRAPTRALECFVFGGGLNPMSTPLLMPIMNRDGMVRSEENFMETMIHELLHIFVSTNTREYWKMVREKYNNESILVQNHIIIYAMLEELSKILFNKVPSDFSNDDLSPDYKRAVELVKEQGYKNILNEYHEIIK